MKLSKRQSQILSFLNENKETTMKILSEQLDVTPFFIYLIFVLRSNKINRNQELSDDFSLGIKEYNGFN